MVDTEFKACVNCGKQIKVSAKFCPGCGAENNIEILYGDEGTGNTAKAKTVDLSICPKCNAEVKRDAKFCKKCGAPLGNLAGGVGAAVEEPRSINDDAENNRPFKVSAKSAGDATIPRGTVEADNQSHFEDLNVTGERPQLVNALTKGKKSNVKGSTHSGNTPPANTPPANTPLANTPSANTGKSANMRKRIAMIIAVIGAVTVAVALIAGNLLDFFDGLGPFNNGSNPINNVDSTAPSVKMKISSASGELVTGRTIVLSGEGLGGYQDGKSEVLIGGKRADILSWGPNLITVIIPPDLKGGNHEIKVTGPAGSVKFSQEISGIQKTVLAEGAISKNRETTIKADGVTLIVPAASVVDEEKLTISRVTLDGNFGNAASNSAASSGGSNKGTTVQKLLELDITGENGTHVVFKEPAILAIDLSKFPPSGNSGSSSSNTGGSNPSADTGRYTATNYDDWLGIWTQQESYYDKAGGILYIKAEHFSFEDINFDRVPSKTEGKVEGEYCIAYYWLEENPAGANSGNATYKTSYDVAAAAVKYFDEIYKKYEAVMGRDNMPDFRKEERKISEASYWDWTVGKLSGAKTITTDNRVRLDLSVSNDTSAAMIRPIKGSVDLPLSYASQDELKGTIGHELFHLVQAKSYGMMKTLVSSGKQKGVAGWVTTKAGFQGAVIHSGFFIDATAEYAAEVIALGKRVDLPKYSNTKIGNPFYLFEQVKESQEYGMAAFIQYLVDKSVFMSRVANREKAFRDLWINFVKEARYSSDIIPALDRTVSQLTGHNTTQGAYGDFWTAVITDSDAANYSANNGIDNTNIPNSGIASSSQLSIKAAALAGGYAAANLTPMSGSYGDNAPNTLVQSLWVQEPTNPNLSYDVFVLNKAASGGLQNGRTPNKLGKATPYQTVLPGGLTYPKPIIINTKQLDHVIRIFARNKLVEAFNEKVNILFSNVVWKNEDENVKFYSSNYTSPMEREFKFELSGFDKQYKGGNALLAGITWGDGTQASRVENVEANSTITVKHTYAPSALSNKPKITIYVKDANGTLLHQYEKEISIISIKFKNDTYSGSSNRNVDVTVTGNNLPKKVRYSWDWGDGKSGITDAPNASHSYAASGKYNIMCQALDYDTGTPIASAKATVTIAGDPTPTPTSVPSAFDPFWIGTWTHSYTFKKYDPNYIGTEMQKYREHEYKRVVMITPANVHSKAFGFDYAYKIEDSITNNNGDDKTEKFVYYGRIDPENGKTLIVYDENSKEIVEAIDKSGQNTINYDGFELTR